MRRLPVGTRLLELWMLAHGSDLRQAAVKQTGARHGDGVEASGLGTLQGGCETLGATLPGHLVGARPRRRARRLPEVEPGSSGGH